MNDESASTLTMTMTPNTQRLAHALGLAIYDVRQTPWGACTLAWLPADDPLPCTSGSGGVEAVELGSVADAGSDHHVQG